MTAFELSLFLNERDLCEEDAFEKAEAMAKENGLVFAGVGPCSGVEVLGALSGNVRYAGFVTPDGVFDEDERPDDAAEIRLIECGDSKEIDMDIPHETFNVREDGCLVFTGCVFSMDSLKAA